MTTTNVEGTTVSAEARDITVIVNGKVHRAKAEPRLLLSDFIRQNLRLTGTNIGCEQGACGACTVRMNGQIVRSCITLAVQAHDSEIETVEGMASAGELHPIQQAFNEEHGLQCGFCTPGMLLTAQALLDANSDPSDDQIREHMSGNICRCTGYQGIINSVRCAAAKLQECSSGAIETQEAGR